MHAHLLGLIPALLLCPSAAAGDVLLEARGTVVQNSYSSGPFAGVATGDMAVILLEVFVPGTDIAPGQYTEYDIDAGASSFTAGSGSDAIAVGLPVINVQNDFPAADGIRMLGNPLASGGTLIFEFGAPGTLFGSTDVTMEAGSYPAAGSWTSYNWSLGGGGGFMEVQPIEFIIHGGSLGVSTCTATVNSTGQPALITASGDPSVAVNNVSVEVNGLPDQPGVFFFGQTPDQVPFGNGFRCVGFPVVRLNPPVQASGGVATRVIDLPSAPMGPGDHYVQFWYRDPNAGGAGFNLSDAVHLTLIP